MARDISEDRDAIRAHLKAARTIAVVGLSPDPYRTSHAVSRYMQESGYRIIPVNPVAQGQAILGEACYDGLASIPSDIQLDLINVFRRPEYIRSVAEQALGRPAPVFWMQTGISNAFAAEQLTLAGIDVVQDRCIKIEHASLL